MINPFQYGGVVGREAFCNRKQELADIHKAMENGEKIFVYSERRMGKTSLVRLAMEKLPKRQFLAAYIDLWPTDGEASFVTETARAMATGMQGGIERILQMARSLFSRLAPSATVDDEGKVRVTFSFDRSEPPETRLDEVLAAPARLAEQRGCRVVMVFDEFQRLLEYGTDLVERKLRSVIQHQKNVSYIFLGSRKHLIQKMFLDQSRPLYRSGGHYALGPIEEKDWMPFIRKRFVSSGRKIADGRIRSVCRLTAGHPFYTQHLCHSLWELCREGEEATDELIDEAVRLLLDRETYAYTSLWELLALNQRRFRMGLAAEPAKVRVFSSDFISRYGLKSPSNTQRVVDALMERDIIDRDNGSFVIVDRFFKIWISRSHPA